MTVVTAATTREKDAGDSEPASGRCVGSGMNKTAPMPVKCVARIADASRTTAGNVFAQSSRFAAKRSAIDPNERPSATEATTRAGPGNTAWHLQRQHTSVVHRRNAAADDGAAQGGSSRGPSPNLNRAAAKPAPVMKTR